MKTKLTEINAKQWSNKKAGWVNVMRYNSFLKFSLVYKSKGYCV